MFFSLSALEAPRTAETPAASVFGTPSRGSGGPAGSGGQGGLKKNRTRGRLLLQQRGGPGHTGKEHMVYQRVSECVYRGMIEPGGGMGGGLEIKICV